MIIRFFKLQGCKIYWDYKTNEACNLHIKKELLDVLGTQQDKARQREGGLLMSYSTQVSSVVTRYTCSYPSGQHKHNHLQQTKS